LFGHGIFGVWPGGLFTGGRTVVSRYRSEVFGTDTGLGAVDALPEIQLVRTSPTGPSWQSIATPISSCSASGAGETRVVFMGDSITEGWGQREL
jgi:hypothetical protein